MVGSRLVRFIATEKTSARLYGPAGIGERLRDSSGQVGLLNCDRGIEWLRVGGVLGGIDVYDGLSPRTVDN